MLRRYYPKLLLITTFFVINLSSFAQNYFHKADFNQAQTTGDSIVCYGHHHNAYVYLPTTLWKTGKGEIQRTTSPTSRFIVTYNGFTPQARAAFQFAVNIWQSMLSSPVPIRITATFQPLGQNVLGSASPGTFFRNFPGATRLQTWYPVALAEKMAGRNLNDTTRADITANFNSGFSGWYYGTDGRPGTNQFDFVTVVLHEIGHGLGFFSGRSSGGGLGSMLFSGFPIVFDHYVQNSLGQALLNQTIFPDNSTTLGTALVSPLFFDAPYVKSANSNNSATLYSPSTFEPGSSTSHLDQLTYALSGNGLMVPQLNPAYANQSPGPITMNMFAEMGWIHTFLQPDTVKSTETIPANYTVKTRIVSDTLINLSSLRLFYSADTFRTSASVTFAPTATPNEYSATFPSSPGGRVMSYYVTLNDATARTYQTPTEAVRFNNYFQFYAGTDNVPPPVTHSPTTFLFLPTDTIGIQATATDWFDVDTVYVEYSINNVNQPALGLTRSRTNRANFTGRLNFAANNLRGGETIRYRVVARDKSTARNLGFSPTTGFHTLVVSAAKAPQQDYSNNFDTPNDDFVGSNYSIITPSGFASPAIHSDHPYLDGSGPTQESSYIYQLRVPIIVRNTDALVRFDEIVLVEPGETGSTFGQPTFYDYVVLEGSTDGGRTWRTVEPGYDSRFNPAWLNAFNSNLVGINSRAQGTPALYRPHTFNLRTNFRAGDVVLLRFRLFADANVNGWGWAIDNLQIQGSLSAVTSLADQVLIQQTKLYPNPTEGKIMLTAEGLSGNPQILQIEVFNTTGVSLLTRQVTVEDRKSVV
ncbi:MAG TPA: hypothetical protein DCM08_00470, partial [Microscillaceae bacterium]|nr:hypothetical protein [Microscillaceae bacterium]